MSDKNLSAGHYTLKSAKLYPSKNGAYDSNVFYDITLLIPRIQIDESIESDFMGGFIEVFDSAGLLGGGEDGYVVRGEERLVLTVTDTLENEVIYDLFCYKIDDVDVSGQNDMMSYKIHFVSYQAFSAGLTRLITSFKSVLVSDAVAEIFNQYYNIDNGIHLDYKESDKISVSGNKNIAIQATDNQFRCTIPNLTPAEAINFLLKRAYSGTNSPSCSFRFFENLRGYYFVSDEALFNGIAAKEPNSPNVTFKMTYDIALSKEVNPSLLLSQMNNFTMLENPNHVNTFEDIYGGAYFNKVLDLDISNSAINLKKDSFSYNSNKKKYGFNLDNKHTNEFVDGFSSIEKRFLMVKDYDLDNDNESSSMPGNYHYDEIISNRVSFRQHLDGVTIRAKGPGRLDITAGDIIDLDAPEFKSNNKSLPNKKLSGRYIVRSISHDMNMENMTNTYVLSKTGWEDRASYGPNQDLFEKFNVAVKKLKGFI